MRILLDTHLLLWAAYAPRRLGPEARGLLADEKNVLVFSAASLWEIAVKAALGRDSFTASASVLRRGLIEAGYDELDITGRHAIDAGALPPLHKDPFDRMLVAQARGEGLILLTTDTLVDAYGPPARLV